MKTLLEQLYTDSPLDYSTATLLFDKLVADTTHPYQVAAILSYYNTRMPARDEFRAFYDGMMRHALILDTKGIPTIDVCGTGGDGKDTFNISTLAAFVCAGAGVYVAKHGNYAVSSACGSSNVLEHLGIRLLQSQETLLHQLEHAHICLLHAPLFHPAMKHVAPIRKALGVKTIFNLLGPISNPAQNEYQCTGTYNSEVAVLYHNLFEKNKKGYTVLHDMAGFDEISLTGNVLLYANGKQKTWLHLDLPFTVSESAAIKGGDTIESHATIFSNVLHNNCTIDQKNVVIINAALAIQTYWPHLTLEACIGRALESLESGKALDAFNTLKKLQKQ